MIYIKKKLLKFITKFDIKLQFILNLNLLLINKLFFFIYIVNTNLFIY